MGFVFSKILCFALAPLNLAVFLLTAAMMALRARQFVWSRRLGVASWVLLVVFGVLPVGPQLAARLEGAYPYPAVLPRQVDGIILLGGFMDTQMGMVHGTPQMNGAVDRLNAFVDLAQKYPYARLVFASGQGSLAQDGVPEASLIGPALARMRAYTRSRLVVEDKSRTTYENALNAKSLINPVPGHTWLLVTSAWHMPRAMGAFRAVGWDVVPVPSDYLAAGATAGSDWNFVNNMTLSTIALKEVGGIAVYAATGKWKAAGG